MENLSRITNTLSQSLADETFIAAILSTPIDKNAFCRKVLFEKQDSDTFKMIRRFATNEEVLFITKEDMLTRVQALLSSQFLVFTAYTQQADYSLQIDRKGQSSFHQRPPTRQHEQKAPLFLQELGVLTANGQPQKGKSDKFKQIQKFTEVIAGLLKSNPHLSKKTPLKIVDMGAGKGYLTFALYDLLKNIHNINVEVKGVEVRSDLTELCNQIASKVGFEQLRFEQGYINNFPVKNVDILIALHACDIATDEAIFKGIESNADLIICAPCCHKQVRKQMNTTGALHNITRHGIFKERTAEMLTDTIRALILEAKGYKTRIFEFISTEHTGKNIMLVAEKQQSDFNPKPYFLEIKKLKDMYGIKYQYLEKLLNIGDSTFTKPHEAAS